MPSYPGNPYFESTEETDVGRGGKPFNALGNREYSRIFKVVTRNRFLSTLAVCAAPGIPRPFSAYQSGNGLEYDLLAVLIELSAQQDDTDWQRWTVTARYSTEMPSGGAPDSPGYAAGPGAAIGDDLNNGSGGKGGAANNPEEEPPEIEWDFETTKYAQPFDLDGKAYVNSAGDPFTPAPTIETGHAVLSMTRNETAFNLNTASRYSYALNSDVFLGAAPETCQLMPPKAKYMFRGTLPYYRVSYKFRFNYQKLDGTLQSWQPQLLDQGMMRKQTTAGRPELGKSVPIRRGPNAITSPVLLDGNGQEAVDQIILGVNVGKIPNFIKFKAYRLLPFIELFQNGFAPGIGA
jgi:hypothetical protein